MQQSIFRIKKCLTQDIVRDILRKNFLDLSFVILYYPSMNYFTIHRKVKHEK